MFWVYLPRWPYFSFFFFNLIYGCSVFSFLLWFGVVGLGGLDLGFGLVVLICLGFHMTVFAEYLIPIYFSLVIFNIDISYY